MVYGGYICAVYRLPGAFAAAAGSGHHHRRCRCYRIFVHHCRVVFCAGTQGHPPAAAFVFADSRLGDERHSFAVKCRRDFRQSEYVGYDDRIALCGACLLRAEHADPAAVLPVYSSAKRDVAQACADDQVDGCGDRVACPVLCDGMCADAAIRRGRRNKSDGQRGRQTFVLSRFCRHGSRLYAARRQKKVQRRG